MTSNPETLVVELRDSETRWPEGDPCYMGLRVRAADEIERLYKIVRLQRLAIEAHKQRQSDETKPARDAEHCDYPDCEQHWTAVVDMALTAMAKFHATFQPADDAELTPWTSPAALREFVDEHARLLRVRASGANSVPSDSASGEPR